MKITNDPFAIVIKVFQQLYPDKTALIQWDDTLDASKKEYGSTTFQDDGIPVIGLNPNLIVLVAVEILAHELAHVAAGIDAKHNDEWDKCFEAIHNKYFEIIAKPYDT